MEFHCQQQQQRLENPESIDIRYVTMSTIILLPIGNIGLQAKYVDKVALAVVRVCQREVEESDLYLQGGHRKSGTRSMSNMEII